MLESGETKRMRVREKEGRHIRIEINFVMLVQVEQFVSSRQNRTVVVPGAKWEGGG